MTTLCKMAKPSSALVKLVESVGILLDEPISHIKSKYKAPTPSNYDSTMDRLIEEFPELVSKLGHLDSSDVSNLVASKLFSKTIEAGYDYEAAVAAGGLEARDLFNGIVLIMSMLQEEKHRIPIKKMNLLVLVDGSRPSYVTLDTAAHLHKHGICTVNAVLPPDGNSHAEVLMCKHLPLDLHRRCQDQYQMPLHTFEVGVMKTSESSDGLQDEIRSKMKNINSNTLVLGIETNFSGTDTLSAIPQWAAWEEGYITVLVKSSSRLRPFSSSTMSRTIQCCLKNIDDLDIVFGVCLTLMSPGDHVVFCSVVDNGQPKGDSQETRFDVGSRQRWIAGSSPPQYPTDRVDWNDAILADLSSRIDELTTRAQISGKPVLYKHNIFKTVAQELCAVASEENVDMILLRRGSDREVTKEVIANSTCSVILCD